MKGDVFDAALVTGNSKPRVAAEPWTDIGRRETVKTELAGPWLVLDRKFSRHFFRREVDVKLGEVAPHVPANPNIVSLAILVAPLSVVPLRKAGELAAHEREAAVADIWASPEMIPWGTDVMILQELRPPGVRV